MRPFLLLILLGLAFYPSCSQSEEQAQSFWKLKQGAVVDLTPYRFFLPGSKSLDLKDWKDKPVLLIYITAFDAHSLEFAKLFEEKAWLEIKNKDLVCYFVGYGEQMPTLMSWYSDNNFSFPIATDSSKKLHSSLCNVSQAFPHIIMLDREHRFCVGIVGGMDPGSEEFMKMINQVVETGCPPTP